MFTYRITETDSCITVGTDEEPVLVCAKIDVAHQVVADAKLLATMPAKPIFARRAADTGEVKDAAPPAPEAAPETSRASRA